MNPPESATAEATPERAAGPEATGPRAVTEETLLDFVWIADPQLSPDGRHVAFTRVTVDRDTDDYRTSLWIAAADDATDARPLTSGVKDGQPRWSPDGDTIAFVRVTEKDKPPQIHLLPMTGGEAMALTSLAKGATSPAWSPDGTRIAFASGTDPEKDDPKREKPKHEPARVVTRPVFRENNVGFHDFEHRDHVWVVAATGGEPRPLTRGEHTESGARWSRDGRWILFVSDRRPEPWFGLEESKVYAVAPDLAAPTDGADLRLVVDYRGAVAAFDESADRRFAVIGIENTEPHSYEQMNLLVFDGAWPMTRPRVLNANRDYALGEGVGSDQHPPRGGGESPLRWSGDGACVYVMGAREGSSMLLRVDAATGELRELTPRSHDLVSATATADGRRWALAMTTVERPSDLYLLDVSAAERVAVEAGALRRRVTPNDAALAGLTLGAVEEFWYPSFDGTRIQAWIVKPPGFDPAKKYPAILQIHGGPHAAYGVGFFHEFHQLANAGYVVLYTNPRGSTSYGWEFANIIQYRYPGDDAKDLLAGVDELVRRGYVDETRLGVTGGSGGGLLTNWLVTQTHRFAAAITQRCVSDWAAMMYTCDFAMFEPYWFRGQPFQVPDQYAAMSPATHVDKIETPLMVIHSEEDWRTPIGQGEIMFRALKYRKKPTVMIRFPGENHELSRSGLPSHRVQNQQHIRRWFDHWLQGKPAPEYGV